MRSWLLASLFLSLPASAEDLIIGSVGGTDALSAERPAAEVRLEYRPDLSLAPFIEPYAALRPWVGVEATSRGSVWGGGGILIDIGINQFALVPSFGVGGYQRGDGKNLGSVLEFRTGIEVAYKFADHSRVALGFSHMSNGGLARHNPGTEALMLSYQFPFESLFGR